jgi:hypothetical protein
VLSPLLIEFCHDGFNQGAISGVGLLQRNNLLQEQQGASAGKPRLSKYLCYCLYYCSNSFAFCSAGLMIFFCNDSSNPVRLS